MFSSVWPGPAPPLVSLSSASLPLFRSGRGLGLCLLLPLPGDCLAAPSRRCVTVRCRASRLLSPGYIDVSNLAISTRTAYAHAQRLQQTMAGHSLRVMPEKGQFRSLPAGETKSAPRGEVPCAIAAHATKSDGSAGRAGEVAVVIHQVALGMRFSSDLKLGDLVPLEPGVPGTTYSFEV
eukprot:scaffold23356_cov69-Phaeocystis_antarctica.AAC.2